MKKLKHIGAVVAILTAFLFLSGCSAQKRLNRIVDKHPELVQVDTITIPEIKIDTFFSIDTQEVAGDIDSIFLEVPAECEEIKDDIITYIIDREILKDTVSYVRNVKNDSIDATLQVTIWQEEDKVRVDVALVDSKVLAEKVVYVEKKVNRPFKTYTTLAILALSLVFLILLIKK